MGIYSKKAGGLEKSHAGKGEGAVFDRGNNGKVLLYIAAV